MTSLIVRADAAHLPLPDASVDLVVTSPPYWSLRAYSDDGRAYAGQIGAEPTVAAYIDNLLTCTAEWMRVLKPCGSIWVNLGDKYAGSASGPRKFNEDGWDRDRTHAATRLERRTVVGVPQKSLIGLPWRYALGCLDELGLILRAEVIWNKPNGLPESVTDRVRRSHETWFHLTKAPRYYSSVDNIREPHTRQWGGSPNGGNTYAAMKAPGAKDANLPHALPNPVGKLPGSVWTVATQPFKPPPELGVDHYAAFPLEWPRRIIAGWSPSGVCTGCGEGRRPVVERVRRNTRPLLDGAAHVLAHDGDERRTYSRGVTDVTLTGESCACAPFTDHPGDAPTYKPWREYHLDGWSAPPTNPAVILDPFSGTGTTVLVASALGRYGIGVDMSADYCRLAKWRVNDPAQRAKALGKAKPPRRVDGQLGLDLGGIAR